MQSSYKAKAPAKPAAKEKAVKPTRRDTIESAYKKFVAKEADPALDK